MNKILKIFLTIITCSVFSNVSVACKDDSDTSITNEEMVYFQNSLKNYFQKNNLQQSFYNHSYNEIEMILDNYLIENNLKGKAKFLFARNINDHFENFVSIDVIKTLGTIFKTSLVLFWDKEDYIILDLFDTRPLFSELDQITKLNSTTTFDIDAYGQLDMFSAVKLNLTSIFSKLADNITNLELSNYLQETFNISEQGIKNYLEQQLKFNLNFFELSEEMILINNSGYQFEINNLESDSSWFHNSFFKFDNYSDQTTLTKIVFQKSVTINNELMNILENQYKIGQKSQGSPTSSDDDISLNLSGKGITNLKSAMPYIYEYVTNWLNLQFKSENVVLTNEDYEIKILKALSSTSEDFYNGGWSEETNFWSENAQVSAITKGNYFGATRNILNVTIMTSNNETLKVINDGPARKLCAFHLPVIL